MKVKFIHMVLIILLLGSGMSCGRSHQGEEREGTQDQAAVTQETEQRLGQEGGRQRQAAGRGFAQRALGKRGRRGWGANDVVVLSEAEMKMIEIQTEKATFQSMRSHLTVMGKVLAHPLRKSHCQLCLSSEDLSNPHSHRRLGQGRTEACHSAE